MTHGSLKPTCADVRARHVQMWELDNKGGWVPKNWCFQIVVLEKTLRGLWTARRWNQSVLKEINPEYSLGGLILKLKLQYFGHLMQRADSLEKPWCWERFRAGGEEGNRAWDGWMASPTQWTWFWANSGRWWRWRSLVCYSPWGYKELDATEQQQKVLDLNHHWGKKWSIFIEMNHHVPELDASYKVKLQYLDFTLTV